MSMSTKKFRQAYPKQFVHDERVFSGTVWNDQQYYNTLRKTITHTLHTRLQGKNKRARKTVVAPDTIHLQFKLKISHTALHTNSFSTCPLRNNRHLRRLRREGGAKITPKHCHKKPFLNSQYNEKNVQAALRNPYSVFDKFDFSIHIHCTSTKMLYSSHDNVKLFCWYSNRPEMCICLLKTYAHIEVSTIPWNNEMIDAQLAIFPTVIVTTQLHIHHSIQHKTLQYLHSMEQRASICHPVNWACGILIAC